MPMVTTRMREAVPITMPSAVRMKRTLLLQNVSNEKARISPTAIFDRIGIWVATLLMCPYRCYVGGRGLARLQRDWGCFRGQQQRRTTRAINYGADWGYLRRLPALRRSCVDPCSSYTIVT